MNAYVVAPDQVDRELYARYMIKRRNCTESTAKATLERLRRIERVCGKPVEEVTGTDLELVYMLSDYSPATKNADLVAIRGYHVFRAKVLERCKLNGIMDVASIRHVVDYGASLTNEEARYLLSFAHTSRQIRVVYLGLYQGMRVSDSATLHPGHVVQQGTENVFRFRSQKSRRRLEIPIHPEVNRVLDVIFQEVTTKESLKAICRRMTYKTGIYCPSHSFRRTFSRKLLDEGVAEGVVERLLGHAPSTTLRKHYAPASNKEMIAGLAKCRY